MTKEKQIEENELHEFVITLSDCQHRYDKECTKAIATKTDMPKANKFYAKYLMEQGYRKQSEGEWIDVSESYCKCSNCGTNFEALPTNFTFKENNIYCRHCGAKMKGGSE